MPRATFRGCQAARCTGQRRRCSPMCSACNHCVVATQGEVGRSAGGLTHRKVGVFVFARARCRGDVLAGLATGSQVVRARPHGVAIALQRSGARQAGPSWGWPSFTKRVFALRATEQPIPPCRVRSQKASFLQLRPSGRSALASGALCAACSPKVPQTSICSAISSASSTSIPRYLTVLSNLLWPSRIWTARRFFVFL